MRTVTSIIIGVVLGIVIPPLNFFLLSHLDVLAQFRMTWAAFVGFGILVELVLVTFAGMRDRAMWPGFLAVGAAVTFFVVRFAADMGITAPS